MKIWLNHYGPLFAAASVFLGMSLFAAAGLYTFRQQNHVDEELCIANVENRAGIRATWLAARRLVVRNLSDEEQIARTNLFFAEILRPIPSLVCVDNEPVPKEG